MLDNFSWVIPGRLAGAALPGGYTAGAQPALDDLRELRERGVRCLVSLSDRAEAFGPLCEQAGLEWLYHPLPEFGIPEDDEGFAALVRELQGRLERGVAVCAHCYAGVGRTGLLLCCLVGRHLGLPAAEAITRVRAVRRAIETPEQERYVHRYLRRAEGGAA